MPLLRRHRHHSKLTFAALLACASPAFATSATWTSPNGGDWFTSANWSTNPNIPNAIDDSATFTSTAAGDISISAPITLGSLTIESPLAFDPISTGNLTLQTSSGNATISITNSVISGNVTFATPLNFASPTSITYNSALANIILSGTLSGTAPFTLNSPANIALSGSNTLWNGDLILNAANVTIPSISSLSTGNLTLNNGATLNLPGPTANVSNPAANPITLNNGSLLFNTNIPVVNRPLFIDTGGGTVSSPTSTLTIIAPINGNGTLVISNTLSTVISSNNTFGGGINDNAGNLRLNTSTAAGTGLISNFGGLSLQLAPSTIISNNYLLSGSFNNEAIDVPDTNSTATFAGAFELSGTAQLRLGTTNTASTLILTGTTALTGSPVVLLTKNNVTFAGNGSLSVPNSSIQIGVSSNNANLNLVMNNNSSISAGKGITLGGSGTGGTDDLNTNVALNGNASLNANKNPLNLNAGSSAAPSNVLLQMNINSTLTASALTMTGTNQGTTTLNFNGATIIATGGDTSTALFFPDFSLPNSTNHKFPTTTTIQPGGLTLNGNGFNITIAQPLLGSIGGGGFTKNGNGTVTLTGNNKYQGLTTVNAGTLYAENTAGTATGFNDVTVASGATFGGLGTIAGNINALGSNATISPGFLGSVGNLTLGTGINSQNVNLNSGDAITINFAPDGSLNSEIDLPNGYVVVNIAGGGSIGYTLVQAGTNIPFDIDGTYSLYHEALGYIDSSETSTILNPQPGVTYTFTHTDTDYQVRIAGGQTFALPEPTTLFLLASPSLLLLKRRKKINER